MEIKSRINTNDCFADIMNRKFFPIAQKEADAAITFIVEKLFSITYPQLYCNVNYYFESARQLSGDALFD